MNTKFINLSDYPIHLPESNEYRSFVLKQRQTLLEKGMINLKGFLTQDGIASYKKEVEERMDFTFHAVSERHPYGYHPSKQFPSDHPRNTFGATESHRLARHHLPNTAIDALYCWPPMRRFIADVTDNEQTFLSGDPSNGLVVQVYREGCGQAWHFDQALYSTIINLSASEAGGVFECVPNLRTNDDSNYGGVKQVLDGSSNAVQQHHVQAGSFSIMLGRYTMHRVTKVEKNVPRISVILSYELQPNIHMDWETRRKSFGPTTPKLP